MNKQPFYKKIDYTVWAIILTIMILFFINILVSIRYWELSEEITLLSSNINEIILSKDNINKDSKDELKDKEEPKDDSDLQSVIVEKTILDVKSAGYYYSSQGDQLGIGPLPPIVDIQTNYWVFWEIESFNKDLENFVMTAQLPDNVIWTGNKTVLAGKLNFGQMSKQIVWEIDKIEKDGDYKMGFEIGLIPVRDDIGKILNLLTDIKYQAKDKLNQEIKNSLNNITTDLIFDNLVKGKAKVVPFE
ncbi:MAG: hypothetical protein ISS02_02360 [Candidatus Portnoybacteria bacterium]|nr:hypothetical protein [Candidatus Portnoybacteria bacterium]